MFLRSWKADRREFEGSWGGLEGSLRSWKGEMGVFGGLQSLCGVSGGLGVSWGPLRSLLGTWGWIWGFRRGFGIQAGILG